MQPCKICGAETDKVHDKKFKQDYFFCPGCRFISLEEAKIPSPEEEKEDYLSHDNSLECQGYVNMFREFIEKAVSPFISAPADVLDFGCGHGPVLAHLLKEKGFRVDTYDPYFAPGKVYENKSYNMITSTEVVEHLRDPMKELKLLKSLLKPGALLAVMTLFHPDDEKKFLEWYYKREITHIAFYKS
jgi:2-polyprenyl-3-methyl-5-hydroxy-6-metoxy-1,4-benzoquinol methylase